MTTATQVILTTTFEVRVELSEVFEGLTKLEDEEPLKFVWRGEQDRELHRPEDEMADHLLSSDTD